MNQFGSNPLLSDERTRTAVPNIDFGGNVAGLDTSTAPAAALGLRGMPNVNTNADLMGEIANFNHMPVQQPVQSTQPQMFISPSTGEMIVNGFQFNQRNASQGLASEQYARQPRQQFTLPDTATDWRELSVPEYQNYINSIRNPSYGRRIGEAWEHAWRGMGDTYIGAGLAANPDWEWGQEARQNLVREFEENAPFMLRMRDVQDPGDALTYASQMLVQGVPWLVDTMAWMAAGAVVTGGVGAPVGSAEALIAREALRRGTATAVRNNLANGARAYEAARAASGAQRVSRAQVLAHAAPEAADDVNRFFNFGERAFQLTRGASINLGGPGAVGAGFMSNYATGVGDIRNTIADAGGDPTTAESMGQIWGMALPYAAIESVGDLIITQPLTRVFPNMMGGPSHIGNALRGAATGFGTEAAQESAQYGITQNAAAVATDTTLSIEPMDLLEVAVGGGLAGAGVGGLIGGLGPRTPPAGLAPTPDGAPTGPAAPEDLLRMSGTLGAIRERDRLRTQGPLASGLFSQAIAGVNADDPNSINVPAGNNMRPGGINYGLMSQAMAGSNTNPALPQPSPVGDDGPGPMGGLTPPTFDYEDRPYTMTEEILHGRDVVPPSPTANMQAERVRLQQLLLTTTDPQQRANILQAIEVLQGGRDVDYEAADRAASNIGSGYIDPGNMQGPPDLRVPITEQELARLKAEIAQQRAPKPTNVVPGPAPTDMDGITDPNSPEFQRRWPELSAHLAAQGPQQPYISPMEAAQQQPLDRQAIENARMEQLINEAPRAGPLRTPDKSKLDKPITQADADRLQAQANLSRADGLRGRTEEAAEPIGDKLRARARELANTKNEQSQRAIKDTEQHLATRRQMEEDSIEYLKKGPKRKRGGDGAALPELQSERARKLVERLNKKFGAKETTDAVQKRSPKATPIQDKPRTGEEDGSRDATRSEAPRKSTKPASDETVQKPEVEQPGQEDIRGYKVDSKRIDTAMEQGRKQRGTLYSLYQSASALLGNYKHADKEVRLKTKIAWAIVDGLPLEVGEVQALIQRLVALDVNKSNPNGKAEPKAEAAPKATKPLKQPKPAPAPRPVPNTPAEAKLMSEVVAIRFGLDLVKESKSVDPKHFPEYVRFNRKEATAWLSSVDAQSKAGLANKVRTALGLPPAGLNIRRAVMQPPPRKAGQFLDTAIWGEDGLAKAKEAMDTALARHAEKIHYLKLEWAGRKGSSPQLHIVNALGDVYRASKPVAAGFITAVRKIANVHEVKVERLKQNQYLEADILNATDMALVESSDNAVEIRIPEQLSAKHMQRLTTLVNASPHDNVRVVLLSQDGTQSRVNGKDASLEAIRGAHSLNRVLLTAKEEPSSKPKEKPELSIEEIKSIFDNVMKRIPSRLRYRTVHIVNGFQEWLDGIDTVKLKGEDGRTYTLREVAQFFDPDTKPEAWLEYNFGESGAAHIPHFDAFYLDKAYLQQGNEDELLSVIEHELVVHHGLDVLFPDEVAKQEFLTRVGQIPGVEEQRQQLLWARPVYKKYPYHTQIEEVIAFTAMEGPLALEALLSLPENTGPAMRKGIWEEFKQLVKAWIKKVFGDTHTTADMVLDFIVSGLREHAILGEAVDLNQRLTAIGVPTYEKMRERAPHLPKLQVKRMATTAAAASVDETMSKLYGGSENPGRPYTPQNYPAHLKAILDSSATLTEKAKETLDGVVGTSANEVWKKASRNIEPLNNMALRSTLVEKTMRIMHNTIKVARRLMTKRLETRGYAANAALRTARKMLGDTTEGSTQEERDAYNRMAIVASNGKLPLTSEAVVNAAPRILVQNADGTYSINSAVFESLLALGTYTKAEFEAGIPQYTVSGDGVATEVEVAKLPQAVIDAGYDMYVKETRHMAESILEVLEHGLIALSQRNDGAVAELVNANAVKEADQAFVTETLERMHKLYSDIAFHNYSTNDRKGRRHQEKKARQVLSELMRTMHVADKVKDWTDSTVVGKKGPRSDDAFKWREQVNPSDDVKPFTAQIHWFLDNMPGTTTPRLQHLHDINVVKGKAQRQYDMLGSFQALLNAEMQARQYENSVIQSVLGNYVEFTRKGKWRVYIDVKDKDGNPAQISAAMRAVLPVIYAQSEREAKKLQAALAEELAGEHQMLDADDEPITVTFDIGRGDAPGVPTLADTPNIQEFVRIADVVGLALNAEQMKKIANLIEHASARKRFGLQRAGSPGMDENILHNNSETMTRRAWRAAKLSQAWMLDSVFADKKNSTGDWSRLEKLQRDFDMANRGAPEGKAPPTSFVRNEDAVYIAETKLLRYANQLRYMSTHTLSRPTVDIRTTKGEQKLKIEPEAEAHLAHAIALREALKRNELELNLNDLLSKTGPLRMLAVTMQLGSVAAGVMNAFTLITHLPHVLAARHDKTGYGEGFNYSEVISNIISAASHVGTRWSMEDSAKLKATLDAAKAGNNKTNLTIDELEFMYKETLEGLLMPQQTYSMTGGTESSISSLLLRNAAQTLLKPFGAVEAANRRISALATYRMAKARYIRAGVDPKQFSDMASKEFAELMEDIERVVFNSQGDYSNVNRPKAFRGDLSQYVLQYKMFPLITINMINNLPLAQKAAVLGVLFLLGGLKGEPFADDIADIYDTLLQKLGFRHDSVELQLIQALEQAAPGSSKWVMHGFIDTLAFGGTMSSRVSMGDILPLTGVLRPEADVGRELANAFGPAYASNMDTIEFIGTTAEGIAQLVGVKDRTMTFADWIRANPQAQFRAIGEAGLMATTGEITDPRGRLVSDEVTFGAIVARLMGFYPLEATKANNAVRLDRMHIGYMRAVRARYILAYANAYRADDRERMDSIRNAVDDWNDAADQTGQEDMLIRNFRSAAVRAGRAASQTTIERTSKGAPDYSLIDELATIVNADTESDED